MSLSKSISLYILQLDVTSAQLLVTDNDFRSKDFRKQLNETVKSLLALKVIPIFNENDAVSTRKAPYEVCPHFVHRSVSLRFIVFVFLV